jgi:peroxisomal 2,4-dienoyl-CoA reductase
MVALGANACIIGRNVEKTENMAKDIATARSGAKVIGIGAVDVRKPELLQQAAERCAKELGSIDFVIAGAAVSIIKVFVRSEADMDRATFSLQSIKSHRTR